MKSADHSFEKALQKREAQHALRSLKRSAGMVDFCSNDYLGIAKQALLGQHDDHGSGGSRLLSGNTRAHEEAESQLATHFGFEACLLYQSGYTANLGLLSCIGQRGDTIVYDALAHASIRDGIRMGVSRSFSFQHNDLQDLEKKLEPATGNIFVVVESVYSMTGDQCPLEALCQLLANHSMENKAIHLIVDEAHATGVVGPKGLVQKLGLESQVWATVITCGKALGTHGGMVFGSKTLISYLINFSRPFIYTTAISEGHARSIVSACSKVAELNAARQLLWKNIAHFEQCMAGVSNRVLSGESAIQAIQIEGNTATRKAANTLQEKGWNIFPILSPTVPEGEECLRVSLHSFNTLEEIDAFANDLKNILQT